MPNPKAALASAREKRPALDHLIRAYGRFTADAGNRQAAAVTFFGFLSFFPILALATAILSYALGDDAVGTVVDQVNSYAPGLAEQLQLEDILSDNAAAGATGLLGLAGLLYSGLGWVDALREAIRAMWHHNVKEGNFVVKKVKDVVVLVGLGATIVLSVGVSAATGAFTGFALGLIGVDDTDLVAVAIAKVVGFALGLLTSTALFLYLFWRLPRVQAPFRRVIKGALLAGVLFEVLKRVGAVYIERTTENPLYGAFAVIVGLLVWINIVSRMLLICAAWTVTAPYDSDVEPSGTASEEAARKAGIPTEFADQDPDDPPVLQEDGAPSPLVAAVEGRMPSQDVPEGRAGVRRDGPADRGGQRVEELKQDGSGGDGASGGGGTATLVRPQPLKGEAAVRSAAQFTAGALGMAAMAVVLYVLKTLRGLVRR
jgi:membrane protein